MTQVSTYSMRLMLGHTSQTDVASLQDFFSKECFAGHPKPYVDFMEWRKQEDELIERERQKLIPGM